MSQTVAVAHPSARGITTPALAGYPSTTRPLRSSPLAGPAFSTNPSIQSKQSQSTGVLSLDVRPHPRSTPSSITSHNGASTSSHSSHAHRAAGTPAGPSKSTSSIPTLNLDSRSPSQPSSVISHTGSLAASASSFSSHAHSAYRHPVAQTKSTGAIPTLSLFRRQAKDEPSPPPPTQAPFGHNRSESFAHRTASPPAHIPQTYSPRASRRPTTAPGGPSVSRNPDDNWMSSSPFGPATTPRFSRQEMSSKPVVMPLSAREYRRQKCTSMITNVVPPVTSCPPVTEGMGEERVTHIPHIIVSHSESTRVARSGNRSSRRASSPSLPRTTLSQATLRSSSPEPQLSPKSSIGTFFSLASENEAERGITVIDPRVTPRRRQSLPNASQRHSRLSLVDAVNRLSQISTASADTEFFDTEDNLGVRQRPISVTEDDGVFRRASSRRKNPDMPSRETSANPITAEPIASQEHARMVRIAEACETSSDRVPGSKFSDSSHDPRPECGTSADIFPDRAISQSKTDLHPLPGAASPESQGRRKKLTKSRTQSVQVPSARLGSSLPWIPSTSPFKTSVKQNAPMTSLSDTSLSDNVPQSHETGNPGKDSKRRTRRLTFQFIPSPSFYKRPKTAPGVTPSHKLTLPPPTRHDTRERMHGPESGFGTGSSTISSLTLTTGSATTITLMPPPPITSSSSVSSSAANSTSSLTGSSTTMMSPDTSATSIAAPSLTATSRLEQSYPMVSSNLKESLVVQSGGDSDDSEFEQENSRDVAITPPSVIASNEHEPQETSPSLSPVSSYVSFSSSSTPGFIPTPPAAKIPPCSRCSHPENTLDSHPSVKRHTQAPDPNYIHPMWAVPMVTTTAASQATLPGFNDISSTAHERPVQPIRIPPSPVPTLKTPSVRPTARLKRPRPQTAPNSPLSTPIFPTPPPLPRAPKVRKASSGFKSILRSLIGHAG